MRAGFTLVTMLLAATAAAQSTIERIEPVAPPTHEQLMAYRAAAERGLAYLRATQRPNGCWTGDVGHKQSHDYLVLEPAENQIASGGGHLGLTALAGLAFLGGGHLPGRGGHGDVVQRTLEYVLDHVNEDGYITDSGTRMYSHAFGTLFLAQVHGMVVNERLRPALEHAVHWIIDTQNELGAWRYNPFTTQADLSVTVCQLQALRAARNIGIHVPKATIDRAVHYVERSRTVSGPNAGLYFYKIAGRGALQKNTQFAINAAAVTSLYSAGVHDAQLVDPALSFLADEYPYVHYHYRSHYYYWYGNYYAAQAFFQAGGDRFDAYHTRVCRDLLDSQRDDGGWTNDVGPGDALSTAIATMILEIPQQYLPIFQR